MQTRALRTLLEIERSGSFAAAAAARNMTVSAVSMQMKSLEAELGTILFDRSYRPPKLTPVGKSVCQSAAQLIRAEAEMIAACQPSDHLTGSYRIGFVPTASIRLLPGFLTQAQNQAPNAAFDVETGLSDALEDRLLTGRLDFAVVTAGTDPTPGLAQRLLRHEPLVFVAPAALADQSLPSLFPKLPFYHFLPQSGIGKLIDRYVSTLNAPLRRAVYLDSVEAIMGCVNAGLGFTLLPQPDVDHHIGDRAAIVGDGDTGLSRRLVLAWSERSAIGRQSDRIADLFPTAGP